MFGWSKYADPSVQPRTLSHKPDLCPFSVSQVVVGRD